MMNLFCKNIYIHAKKIVTLFYAASIAVHLLVICKVIPYTWVNGGMSKSYSSQFNQSVASMLILCLLWYLSMKIVAKVGLLSVRLSIVLYVLTLLLTISFIMQLIGTTFERYVLGPIVLAGLATHVILWRKHTELKHKKA
jgi:hypothetical protein